MCVVPIKVGTAFMGCRDGAVVRALASHQCGPGSIPRSGVKCGLSLLVLFSAPRGFLRERNSGFPSPLKPKFDLIVLIVSFSCNVPNYYSSARTTRHLNKGPFLFCQLAGAFRQHCEGRSAVIGRLTYRQVAKSPKRIFV